MSFGVGFVEPQKFEILFEDGVRVMAMGREELHDPRHGLLGARGFLETRQESVENGQVLCREV